MASDEAAGQDPLCPGRVTVEALVGATPQEACSVIGDLALPLQERLTNQWSGWAHDGQREPPGTWRVWLMMAGRGFGKTRAGAEWVHAVARAHPEAAIALVAATPEEARAILVEGRSGLLATASRAERGRMQWQPSRRRLRFASGATAYLYGGANAEKLRGPEHHFAWADELAKWTDLETAWSNLMLGLRLGQRPRVLATTTPRRSKFLTALIADPATIRTQGRTRGNPHLSEGFSAEMQRRFGATRLARQELDGELLVDADGALWTRDTLEAARGPRFVASAGAGLERVVIGVDPPASAGGDACGILVCGLARDGIAYVLEDRTASGLQPEAWARRVADAAAKWGAQRIVAEANQGGDMVRAVLRAAGGHLPVALVHATRGKGARAEPVSMAFQQGGARLAGAFPELEDELCALTYAGYQGSGRSPDRADAMVWAMAELLGRGGTPRVRSI